MATAISPVLARCCHHKGVYLESNVSGLFLSSRNASFLFWHMGFIRSGPVYIWALLSSGHTVVFTEVLSYFINKTLCFLLSQITASKVSMVTVQTGLSQCSLWCFWWSFDCGRDWYGSRKVRFVLFCFGDRLHKYMDKKVVKVFAAHKMQHVTGSLPALSFDGLRVAVTSNLNPSLHSWCDVEEMLQTFSTSCRICMNEFSVSCC